VWVRGDGFAEDGLLQQEDSGEEKEESGEAKEDARG
jgi:hypothetical protein